ncbi:MAG: HD-GYP domain-containing protein [Pirellulaceae bacterium]|nr:HD-GYP domain-containing protein [Pirellulaceae bacterium]
MSASVSYNHPTSAASELAEDTAQLAMRLGGPVVQIAVTADQEPSLASVKDCLIALGLSGAGPTTEACWSAARALQFDGQALPLALAPDLTLVFYGMGTEPFCARLVTAIAAPPAVAKSLMQSAGEATRLQRQAAKLQTQLDISAQQLAQSFEEQCWLRDLARNMSISHDTANANLLAQGILKPLLDLLRTETLYLLVRDDETTRSGLASCYFGSDKVSLPEMASLLPSLIQNKPTGAIVLNHAHLLSERVQSLVAVPVLSCDRPLGYIVAINRTTPNIAHAFSLLDPEFGTVEVGLLEEASVLLSTQTHNIRLILDSQHLALGTLQAMSRAIDARDPYTRGHSERVARLSFEIAEILGLEETACQEIYVAGILHDVGKIGIPDRVLLKPGALSDEEFDIIKQHPEIGYRIVEQLGKLHFTLPGVLYHHERWDGRGYPQGLAGDDIPLMARIIAVADSFDAMTSSRPYRHAMPLTQACEIINEGSGKQWDEMLVRCFQHWRQQRQSSLPQLPANGVSLIPQEPPYADITQSILSLQL